MTRDKARKVFLALASTAAIVGGVAGCNVGGPSDNWADVKGVPYHQPDAIEGIDNVDGQPNVTVVCIHGVGFATTTRDYNALTRIPEWDKLCPVATPIVGHGS